MTKRDRLVIIIISFFILIFLVNYYLGTPDPSSGFTEDPRDPSRQIYIDKKNGQYRYIDEPGVEEETGETLHGIQIIN